MGNRQGNNQTEYNKFKQQEDGYLDSVQTVEEKKTNKWKEIGIWVIAIIFLSTSIYYVVDHMLTSRDEVYSSAQIARLSAREAVEQMFEEDENGELTYIRRDLTQEEYDQVDEMVEEVPESSEKVQINIKLREAGEQLQSQLQAIELVNGLKTPGGDPNVDLRRADVLSDADRFPDGFNPEYEEELKTEYQRLAGIINDAHDLKETIQGLSVQLDEYLDKQQLDSLQKQVDALPFSDLKSQLTFDMKALFQEYDRQQEELEEQRLEEERRRKEEEERMRKEEERRRKEEEERLEEEERRRKEQEAILEQQREEERQRQEERERLERLERERIEQQQRQELEEQQRIEQEEQARREQEERERIEREAQEYEEQLRREQEQQEQQQQEQQQQEQSEWDGE